MSKTHLIIPDSHAKPDVDNRRFDWIGKMILDIRPDVVIEMGDLEDMPSLSSYDMGKKSYEGRRYKLDLESAWDARQRIIEPLKQYNSVQRKNGKKQYKPTMYALGGNHFEGRIKRAVELSPMLEGTIGVEDGRHKEFGWDYVPFLDILQQDGFNYSHYFTSGVLGKPIGGEHPSYSLITKQYSSCIQGHSHLFDVATRVRADGSRIWGFHSGCYLDPDQFENYAGPANKMWSRGILVLRGCSNGELEGYEWIGIKEIMRKYGN